MNLNQVNGKYEDMKTRDKIRTHHELNVNNRLLKTYITQQPPLIDNRGDTKVNWDMGMLQIFQENHAYTSKTAITYADIYNHPLSIDYKDKFKNDKSYEAQVRDYILDYAYIDYPRNGKTGHKPPGISYRMAKYRGANYRKIKYVNSSPGKWYMIVDNKNFFKFIKNKHGIEFAKKYLDLDNML